MSEKTELKEVFGVDPKKELSFPFLLNVQLAFV